MEMTLKVLCPEALAQHWEKWIKTQEENDQIRRNGDSLVNEPSIWKEEEEDGTLCYFYSTCTGKGKYLFRQERGEIIFEGYRNSFGNAGYFSIMRKGQELGIHLVTYDENAMYAIDLEVLDFKTSSPDSKFWAAEA